MKYKVLDKIYIDLLENIRKYFHNATHTLHKARNEIKVISFGEKNLVIKSFKIPHIINKFAYSFLRDSKAKKSYFNSLKIIDFVPKPIGYIEFTKFGLLYDSYFVSEEFKYDFTIREPLIDDNFLNKKNIYKAFAYFTYQLHEKGIYHLDYSPGNILIQNKNDEYIFKVIDINRMKFKVLSFNDRIKNFSKLWAKNKDLEIIIYEYSMLIQKDYDECITLALKYSQANKDIKNLKKRIKGKKVVD